ncbi:hypothetical protein PLICRDRAFT_101726 [Plicaturopsis crispa FD-325 SS-3]|nr:hypothetical protein PLICRDRAFT_101726 [Plicaturopsis crispa FD-325 SS-3]
MTVQAIVLRRTAKPDAAERERLRHRRTLTTRIDAFVFWASSARIMWCFFYQPERLPKSYVKWITNLAMVDPRLLRALRAIREGDFSYVRGTSVPPDLLTSYAAELGFPRTWGDPAVLPAYSGSAATKVWERIGVEGRAGVGGLPCELVHGGLGRKVGLGDGCYTNAGVRAGFGFLEAIALYLPVHFIPILLTRPRAFLRPHTLVRPLLGAVRSASFLSSFLLLIWSTLCTGRTFLPALLPSIPHDFWDGPHGAVLAACIACGASIWAEDGRRRGEVALYVLPRAVRACLPRGWGKEGGRGERVTFVLALAALLTGARHRPDALRGLARWTGAFIMRGPDAGFWRKGREGTPGPGPRRVDPLGAPGDSEIGSTASGVQTPRDIRQTPTPPP